MACSKRGEIACSRASASIDLAPIKTQHACQEQFHETVTADDLASLSRATSGQPRASAVLITDPAACGQSLEHSGSGGRTNFEPRREFGRGNLFNAAKAVDRLEIVLHRLGSAFPPCAAGTFDVQVGDQVVTLAAEGLAGLLVEPAPAYTRKQARPTRKTR
jgi:hypothetical protein